MTDNNALPWTERADLIVKFVSPEVAAEKLGRSIEAVIARRRELGLPAPLPGSPGAEEPTKKPRSG